MKEPYRTEFYTTITQHQIDALSEGDSFAIHLPNGNKVVLEGSPE